VRLRRRTRAVRLSLTGHAIPVISSVRLSRTALAPRQAAQYSLTGYAVPLIILSVRLSRTALASWQSRKIQPNWPCCLLIIPSVAEPQNSKSI
jgi:hypothetical protein